MAVEEQFGISISDEEAQRVLTVGDMKRLVQAKQDVTDSAGCLTHRAFHVIRKNAIAEFGLQRRGLRPDTRLETVIPSVDRRRKWEQFTTTMGVALPALVRPYSDTVGLTALILSILVVTAWYGALRNSWSAVLIGLVTAVATGWASMQLKSPLRTRFKAGYGSVCDLCQFLVARHPQVLGKPRTTKWTEEEISCLLRDVIKEPPAVSQFDENSRFVKDLHVDSRLVPLLVQAEGSSPRLLACTVTRTSGTAVTHNPQRRNAIEVPGEATHL